MKKYFNFIIAFLSAAAVTGTALGLNSYKVYSENLTDDVFKESELLNENTSESDESSETEETSDAEIISETEEDSQTHAVPEKDGNEAVEDEDYPAFERSANVEGVIVTVEADEGVFPENAWLSVERLTEKDCGEIDSAIDRVRDKGANEAASYTYDIKVFSKENKEIQPADGKDVRISFSADEVANKNLNTNIYHVDGKEKLSATALDVKTKGDVATAVTSGFSYYTVEFTYGEKQYVLEGSGEIKLADMLDSIGITGEVSSYEVSNSELFNVFLGSEKGIIYGFDPIDEEESLIFPTNNGTIPWILSLKPFKTEEWLKVVIDGIEYEIIVTDDDTSNTVPGGIGYKNTISTLLNGQVAVTADEYVTGSTSPSIVKQPADDTTTVYDFAAGLPLSTIYIDEGELGRHKGTFAYEVADDNPLRRAIIHDTVSEADGVKNSVYYDPSKIDSHLLNGQANELNGPLFSFTFDNAAILSDGTKAKLKITYSNAKIFTDERLYAMEQAATNDTERSNAYYQGVAYLAQGSTIKHQGTDARIVTNTNDGFTQAQVDAAAAAIEKTIKKYKEKEGLGSITLQAHNNISLGKSIDVTYQVIDDKGNPVNGTFIYTIVGINLDRDPYRLQQNAGKGLWWVHDNYPDMHFLSEQIAITNNSIASDYIYVRANNGVAEDGGTGDDRKYYFPQIIEESGKTKFISNASLGTQSNDGLYSSGFVTLANAFSGFTVTSYGHSYGSGGSMNAQAYGARPIWYQYISRTGEHGNIQTTTEGNHGGTLSDSGDNAASIKLDQGSYVVAEGKTVTYTMTPDDKYQISTLKVRNKNGVLQEIKFGDDPLHKMTEGQTVTFRDAANNLVTLTAKANGVFTLTMPYAKADEEVRVTWEPTVGELTVKKETVADNSTFNFNIKASKTEPVTIYSPVEEGSIWYVKDNETGNYNYGSDFSTGTFTLSGTTDDLANELSGITLDERVAVSAGVYLWKTNKKFSDLGLTGTNDDKYVYVDFNTAADAINGDTLSDFMGNVGGTEKEERVKFYLANETTSNVTTYWNFSTGQEQSTDPGNYAFSITTTNKEGVKKFELPVQFKYQVTEVPKNKWKLQSINGDTTKTDATGQITVDSASPTETFLNEPFYDLIVSKTVTGNIGSKDKYFKFDVTVTALPNTVLMLDSSNLTTTGSGTGSPNAATIYSIDDIVSANGRDDDPDYMFGDADTAIKKDKTWISGDYEYNYDPINDVYIQKRISDGEVINDHVSEENVPANAAYIGAVGQQIIVGSGGSVTFSVYMKHDQSLKLTWLPEGAAYAIVETKEDYKVSADLNDSVDKNKNDREGAGTVITIESGNKIADDYLKGDAVVKYTNNKDIVVPTGTESFPWYWVVVTGVLAGGVVVFLIKRRKDKGDKTA